MKNTFILKDKNFFNKVMYLLLLIFPIAILVGNLSINLLILISATIYIISNLHSDLFISKRKKNNGIT